MALAKQANFKPIAERNLKMVEKFPVSLPNEVTNEILTSASACDFAIDFYGNRNWYFGNGTIAPTQYDFRLIAAKEITKGLGITSNMEIQLDGALYFKSMIQKQYFDPGHPQRLQPRYMSPWDSLIYATYMADTPRKLSNGYGILKTPKRGDQFPFSTFFKKFNDAGYYQTGTEGFDMKIWKEFVKLDNWRVVLGEGRFLNLTYVPYASMEINAEYNCTNEFLLSPVFYNGSSIETIMRHFNNGSLYGPLTLEALQMMGHATRQNPNTIEFYSPEESARGWTKFRKARH